MSFFDIPPLDITREHVLAVIEATERRRRVVWTAGRVLKEDGSEYRISTSSRERRRCYLRRLRTILKQLAQQGVLKRRGFQFNYGCLYEVGYDYVGGGSGKSNRA